MNPRRLLLLVALPVLLAACGGSDEPKVSKQQFAERLNAICDRGDQASQSFVNSLREVRTSAEAVQAVEGAQRTLEEGLAELQELPEPEGADGDLARRYKAAVKRNFDQNAPKLEKLRKAFADDDADAARAAFQEIASAPEDNERKDLARRLGATRCAD